jgi:DNA anti-recombination protein RmuC
MAQGVREQAAEVQTALKGLSEQMASGVARRLGHDAVEALQKSCEPLREAIAELDAFGRRTRGECDERFDDLADQVEKVTTVLERVRRPLELVKEHLR